MSFNLLVDDTPTSVSVRGADYEIRTSFKSVLFLFTLVEDEELLPQERVVTAVCSMFKKKPPMAYVNEAYQALWAFIEQTHTKKSSELKGAKKGQIRPDRIDFVEDSASIFSAFMQVYHIDLTESDMHWYKFIALLNHLAGDNVHLLTTLKLRGLTNAEIAKQYPLEKRKEIMKLRDEALLKQDKERMRAEEERRMSEFLKLTSK